MQTALDKLESWSHEWGLQISSTKTKAIIFTRRHIPSNLLLSLSNVPLEFTTKATYLGVILDRQLTWGPQITSLHDRCSSDLRLMSVLAANRWGADLVSLRRLYISLIRPKLDYACFLYSTAAPSHLIKLDRIQFAALRIMLGVLKCTPTYKLEIEANIMPLELRRNLLLTRYTCRIFTIKNHPLRHQVLTYSPTLFPKNSPHLLPVTGRIFSQFQTLNISLPSLQPASMTYRYFFPQFPILCSLSSVPKSDVSPANWNRMFLDLKNSVYSDCTAIYTDGSVQGQNCGCAVWSSEFTILAHLPCNVSIYTAELYAIYCALKFISASPGKYVIFSDSLSSIKALQNPLPATNYLITWILQELNKMPFKKVTLEWLPSHVGIAGNEEADRLARQSLKLSTVTKLSPTLYDQLNNINSHYLNSWQQLWSTFSSSLTNFKTHIGPPTYTHLSRVDQVVITRLRLKTCKLTHSHYFTKSPHFSCTHCTCSMTLQHLFITCPVYHTARAPLIEACTLNNQPFAINTLVSESFPPALLLTFMHTTKLFNMV
jgi:ribonuclease HI